MGSAAICGGDMRTCSKCLVRKQNCYFDKNISCVGGFVTVCKSCRLKRSQEVKLARAAFDVQFWMDKWGVPE